MVFRCEDFRRGNCGACCAEHQTGEERAQYAEVRGYVNVAAAVEPVSGRSRDKRSETKDYKRSEIRTYQRCHPETAGAARVLDPLALCGAAA
jgi:hypothetical protein